MAVYFTSDTHFGHEAIIRLTKRPFSSVEEMDAVLVDGWNTTVSPEDTVYHLGDFAHRNSRSAAHYRSLLNGTIHLILGNHDENLTSDDLSSFASVSRLCDVTIEGRDIVLCHYPMREWRLSYQGSWHLFGHVHGRFNRDPLGWSLDVCVERHSYKPWAFAEIEAVFANRFNPFTDRGYVPPAVRTRAE